MTATTVRRGPQHLHYLENTGLRITDEQIRMAISSVRRGYTISDGGTNIYFEYEDQKVLVAERLSRDEDFSAVPVTLNSSVVELIARSKFYGDCTARTGAKLKGHKKLNDDDLWEIVCAAADLSIRRTGDK
ncbi:MAG: hypothetical protein KJ600_01505 [Nanoarchaeota archaeon]|nr:hypothetical protein [Nanoarchaeota archaeon]MBU1103216.1 hypothetical protein [Nanoarchaeota archaeon]